MVIKQTLGENLLNKPRNILNTNETRLRLNNKLKIDLKISISHLGIPHLSKWPDEMAFYIRCRYFCFANPGSFLNCLSVNKFTCIYF